MRIAAKVCASFRNVHMVYKQYAIQAQTVYAQTNIILETKLYIRWI